MFKKLRLPILAAAVLQFVLAPASDAAFDRTLSRNLLRNIYANSDQGDGGDIYRIIRKALQDNQDQGTDLVNRLISVLEDNLDQLAFDVSKDDLRRIRRQLRSFIRRRDASRPAAPAGNVTPPESQSASA